MRLSFDFSEAFTKDGINFEDIKTDSKIISDAYNKVIDNMGKGWQQWCELPFTSDAQLEEIIEYGNKVRQGIDSLVVLGIGGSALGAIAVSNALNHLHHNELPLKKRKTPKLYIEDNIDPERMYALLDVIDLTSSHFVVITKSGSTSETLSQFMIICDLLKKRVGTDFNKRLTVVTTVGKGILYEVAIKMDVKVFGIGEGVGGRFSVFSAVGLIPFAIMGYNIKALLKGAATLTEASKEKSSLNNPALVAAYIMTEYLKRGKNISVIMPYSDKLKYIADFYCQLWGESLGKAMNNENEEIHCGQTPVKALGVTDQHSQVQLYTEGPNDKVFTFIGVRNFDNDVYIPSCEELRECDFLAGHTLGELINYERIATEIAVSDSDKPCFTVAMEKIDEENLGEILTFFMYETAFAAAMMNINAFDQPGVEFGKKATYAMLGRSGYENLQKELHAKQKSKFIICDKETK